MEDFINSSLKVKQQSLGRLARGAAKNFFTATKKDYPQRAAKFAYKKAVAEAMSGGENITNVAHRIASSGSMTESEIRGASSFTQLSRKSKF